MVGLLAVVATGAEVGVSRNHLVLLHILEDDTFVFSLSLITIIGNAIDAARGI